MERCLFDDVLALMHRDKKARGNELRFVVLDSIGHVFISTAARRCRGRSLPPYPAINLSNRPLLAPLSLATRASSHQQEQDDAPPNDNTRPRPVAVASVSSLSHACPAVNIVWESSNFGRAKPLQAT